MIRPSEIKVRKNPQFLSEENYSKIHSDFPVTACKMKVKPIIMKYFNAK